MSGWCRSGLQSSSSSSGPSGGRGRGWSSPPKSKTELIRPFCKHRVFPVVGGGGAILCCSMAGPPVTDRNNSQQGAWCTAFMAQHRKVFRVDRMAPVRHSCVIGQSFQRWLKIFHFKPIKGGGGSSAGIDTRYGAVKRIDISPAFENSEATADDQKTTTRKGVLEQFLKYDKKAVKICVKNGQCRRSFSKQSNLKSRVIYSGSYSFGCDIVKSSGPRTRRLCVISMYNVINQCFSLGFKFTLHFSFVSIFIALYVHVFSIWTIWQSNFEHWIRMEHGLNHWICIEHGLYHWICIEHRLYHWICVEHALYHWICIEHRLYHWICVEHGLYHGICVGHGLCCMAE